MMCYINYRQANDTDSAVSKVNKNTTSVPEAEFLDEIQPKVLRVSLLAVHNQLYSFALRFIFLQTHTTSYSFYSSVTVHSKGKRRKT